MQSEEPKSTINTDKEIWKQPTTDWGPEDGNDSGMEPTVFVTKDNKIGFCHYGTCAVKPIEEWVDMARGSRSIEIDRKFLIKILLRLIPDKAKLSPQELKNIVDHIIQHQSEILKEEICSQ